MTYIPKLLMIICLFHFGSFNSVKSILSVKQDNTIEVNFSYTDVDNYLHAYSLYKNGGDAVEIFQKEYFDKASPGLIDAISRFDLNAEKLVAVIKKYPKYYDSLQYLKEKLKSQETLIIAALEKLKTYHPDIFLPPVNYIIGGFDFGGNGSKEGPLVGVDIFGDNNAIDMEEFKEGIPGYGTIFKINRIPTMVVHEMIHMQQIRMQGLEQYISVYGANKSLLANAIREGSADYFAKFLTGDTILDDLHEYGDKIEEELWDEFYIDRHNKEYGDWFYTKPKDHEGWYSNIGYYMGSKITQFYFENHPNKPQAIKDIFSVVDYDKFLEMSKYASKF